MKIIVRYLLIIYYVLQVKYKVYENKNYIHHIFWILKIGSGAYITYLKENSQPDTSRLGCMIAIRELKILCYISLVYHLCNSE